MKITLSIVLLFIMGVIICSLLLKSNSRDLGSAAHSIEQKINIIKKIIFSNMPPRKKEMDSCIYLFNGVEDKISASLRIKYNIPKDFEYSLVGILLQNKKEIFSLLNKNYYIVAAWRYTKEHTQYYTIPYVTVVPDKSWHGISSKSLMFPTALGTGVLYIEQTQIDNTPLLELLEISSNGEFLNSEAERLFLERVLKLSANRKK